MIFIKIDFKIKSLSWKDAKSLWISKNNKTICNISKNVWDRIYEIEIN